MWTGRLVKLAAKAAELQTDEPVASLSNLKMHLLHPHGEAVPGDLFAKVLGAPNETATRVVIHFTSVPQEVRIILDVRGAVGRLRVGRPKECALPLAVLTDHDTRPPDEPCHPAGPGGTSGDLRSRGEPP